MENLPRKGSRNINDHDCGQMSDEVVEGREDISRSDAL